MVAFWYTAAKNFPKPLPEGISSQAISRCFVREQLQAWRSQLILDNRLDQVMRDRIQDARTHSSARFLLHSSDNYINRIEMALLSVFILSLAFNNDKSNKTADIWLTTLGYTAFSLLLIRLFDFYVMHKEKDIFSKARNQQEQRNLLIGEINVRDDTLNRFARTLDKSSSRKAKEDNSFPHSYTQRM